MNKFSSLSTSVLLALLTSSFTIAAYADGEGSSRTTPREGNNSINGTASTDSLLETDENKRYQFQSRQAITALPASSHAINAAKQEVAPLLYDQQGLPIISINDPQVPLRTPPNYHHDSKAPLSPWTAITPIAEGDSLAKDADSADATLTLALSLTDSASATNNAYETQADLPKWLEEEEEEEVDPIVTTPEKLPSLVDMSNTVHNIDIKKENEEETLEQDTPSQLKIAFEHPSNFSNSFIVAGDSTIIAYNNEQGNFAITFKLRPLSLLELQTLDFELFKKHLTARFSDKQNMLYGEYDILHSYANVQAAKDAHALPELKLEAGADSSTSGIVLSPSDPYMDLSFKAFLKKNHDGILPDQHTFFYERNILTKGYLATLTCELRGSQAQVEATQKYFEAFSPLCERILNSYSFAFIKK